MRTRRDERVRRLRPYGPALGWALVLLWLGSRPGVAGPDVPGLDKVAHFMIYGILGSLAGWGWRHAGNVPRALVVIALACAVGAADELNQRRVPARTADPLDFMADAAGVVLGFAAGRRRPGRGRESDSE